MEMEQLHFFCGKLQQGRKDYITEFVWVDSSEDSRVDDKEPHRLVSMANYALTSGKSLCGSCVLIIEEVKNSDFNPELTQFYTSMEGPGAELFPHSPDKPEVSPS